MTDADAHLQAVLAPGGLADSAFPVTSRYNAVPLATLEATDGTGETRVVVYLRRRFVPSPERFKVVQEHVVTQGDRLDNITAHYLGDPEQFWRICDANEVIRPEELEVVGRRIRITLPEGIG